MGILWLSIVLPRTSRINQCQNSSTQLLAKKQMLQAKPYSQEPQIVAGKHQVDVELDTTIVSQIALGMGNAFVP